MKIVFIPFKNNKIDDAEFNSYRERLNNVLEELFVWYISLKDSYLSEIESKLKVLKENCKIELDRYENLILEKQKLVDKYSKLKSKLESLKKLEMLVNSGKIGSAQRQKILQILNFDESDFE